MKNFYRLIDNMYQAQVKEANKFNMSESLKDAFLLIKNAAAQQGIYIINEQYLDGYFICGTGTNSVVHFYVQGCKNWKWGIWWDYDQQNNPNLITGQLFCMHERYIDKFKPTRGTYVFDIDIELQDKQVIDNGIQYTSDFCDFIKCCHFIHNNPYIAAMKDFHGLDYNYTCQEPIKAFFEYYIDACSKKFHEVIRKCCTQSLLNYLKHYAKKEFEGEEWQVIDFGDYCSPRYELQVKLSEDDEQETGFFSLFGEDAKGNKDKDKWDSKCKQLESIARLFKTYWCRYEVSDFVSFWKQSEYEEYINTIMEDSKEE